MLKGKAVAKGWGTDCLSDPAMPCMCPSIYTSFLDTCKNNCQRVSELLREKAFTIKCPARNYGKQTFTGFKLDTDLGPGVPSPSYNELCSGGGRHIALPRGSSESNEPLTYRIFCTGCTHNPSHPSTIAHPHFYPQKTWVRWAAYLSISLGVILGSFIKLPVLPTPFKDRSTDLHRNHTTGVSRGAAQESVRELGLGSRLGEKG